MSFSLCRILSYSFITGIYLYPAELINFMLFPIDFILAQLQVRAQLYWPEAKAPRTNTVDLGPVTKLI